VPLIDELRAEKRIEEVFEMRALAAVLVVLVGLLQGAFILTRPGVRPVAFGADPSIAAVDAAVKSLDLTPAERKWEQIGWAPDLARALERSRATGRPIFFFGLWGDLEGRC
jgi:hypothetical protein